MDRSQSPSPSFSRRRVLSLAASGTLAVAGGPARRTLAQVTPVASPVAEVTAAGTPVAGGGGAAAVADAEQPGRRCLAAVPAVAEALVAAMQQHRVPGAAIGLLAGEREEHATFGVESLSSLRPVTPETLFQIGSLTKTYTGTAIWRLIDEGALALDAPVRDYLPDFTLMDAEVAAAVTVRNLLDHSAGFYGDEGFETGDGDDAIARYVAERAAAIAADLPPGRVLLLQQRGLHPPRTAHRGRHRHALQRRHGEPAAGAAGSGRQPSGPRRGAQPTVRRWPCRDGRSMASRRWPYRRRSGYRARSIPPGASGRRRAT